MGTKKIKSFFKKHLLIIATDINFEVESKAPRNVIAREE
jgi:hypothetical protein